MQVNYSKKDFRYLFDKKLSSRQKAERLGHDGAQVMERMLTRISDRLIGGKFGRYSQFMEEMDSQGINFNYSRQEHSKKFIEWLLEWNEFHTTDNGVVLREKSGIFHKTVIAEIYKHFDYLKRGSPECDMAEAIDSQGRELLKRESDRFERRGAVFGGRRTRRSSIRRRKTRRGHQKRLVRR